MNTDTKNTDTENPDTENPDTENTDTKNTDVATNGTGKNATGHENAHTTEPRWLSDREQAAWRALVALVTRLPAALDTEAQRDLDMTHFEYFVLAILSEEPDRRRRLSSLATEANASLSRLSHVVTRLGKRGWVRRETTPGVRGADAVLTDEGYARVLTAAPVHVAAVRRLVFDGLDDTEVDDVRRVCTRLVAHLDREIAASPGRG